MATNRSEKPSVVRLPLLPQKAPVARTPADRLLQVGELARISGKTVRAIHHYEELGLLHPDARSKGRFRLYDPSAVTRVRWIGKLHDLGMSLADIQNVVEAWSNASTPGQAMGEVRSVYRAKLEETRAQIAHLAALEGELVASIAYLDTCDSCDSTIPEPPALLRTRGAPAPLGQGVTPQPAFPKAAKTADVPCEACQLREREAEPDLVAGIVASASTSSEQVA